VLAPRSAMTGADSGRASRYQVGDILHYQRGSKDLDIEPRSYVQVIATQPKENLLTVQEPDGPDAPLSLVVQRRSSVSASRRRHLPAL
jgi:hypothetical protein